MVCGGPWREDCGEMQIGAPLIRGGGGGGGVETWRVDCVEVHYRYDK